ncbi:MAG: 50S ribosomal protein L22 [Rickettsiales bacterium]|jgi:large subunit ribosomal protein L22|nr:50S ribosomal protein L22 [Rickettsiales bacterium]
MVKLGVRGESTGEEEKYAQAYLKNLRGGMTKLGKLTKSIQGLPVGKAMTQLSFCNLRLASPIKNLLKSAITNAENNHGMDMDKLVIHRMDMGRAFTMKRSRARAKGRGSRIHKPFCHLRIILAEKEEK